MNGTRGYNNYRGRGSVWKALLALVLVLIILACLCFLLLQQNLVFDSSGSPRLELPWQEEGPELRTLEEPLPELTIENAAEPEPEGPQWEALRALTIPAAPLTQAAVAEAESGYDALAVTLKDAAGWVYFKTDSVLSTSTNTARDTAAALETLTGGTAHTIARLYCFQDHRGGNRNVQKLGLTNTSGRLFYDANNAAWMDPAKADARTFLCNLARDAAELGFDEILLSGVGYPTEGKLDKINYGSDTKEGNLSTFLSEMRAALEPYSVVLSVEVPKAVLTGEGDGSGLSLSVVSPWVDRIYASVEPEEILVCEQAVFAVREGRIAFLPELAALPDPAPERFLLLP